MFNPRTITQLLLPGLAVTLVALFVHVTVPAAPAARFPTEARELAKAAWLSGLPLVRRRSHAWTDATATPGRMR